MSIPSLLDPDGRRAYAFLALLGACLVFTIFAAVGVYLVSDNAKYEFWLALAAHAQIALALSLFGALFVKRTFKAGKDGLEISDHDETAVPVRVTNLPDNPVPVEATP